MKKLLQGILEFRRTAQKDYRASFGALAKGQKPDALFIACSDSRVVPNTFASTSPGDLFVLRNAGNLVAPCGGEELSISDESEAAAIEFSVAKLQVSDIIVCGHSECGAMQALVDGRSKIETPNLRNWLRHGERALQQLESGISLDPSLSRHNQLSQLNVLLQMENIRSYPIVEKAVKAGILAVHGWWFDLARADVYAYEKRFNKFVLIDEEEADRLMRQLKR